MKPHVKARRDRNRAIANQDAAHRCEFCRRALPAKSIVRWEDGKKFCDLECVQDFEEQERVTQK